MKQVFSAAVLPLTESGDFDADSFKNMLVRNLDHGLNGFFIFGSMGEWLEIPSAMKERIMATACETVGNRGEVLAGIAGAGHSAIMENMKVASQFSLNGYVAMLPGDYLGSYDPVSFILSIADKADKPLYFYYRCRPTIPALSIKCFREILGHPNVAGIKNSAGDMGLRKELLMLREELDFRLFEGHEWAVDEALILGCDGVMVGLGSFASKLLVSIARAVDDGRFSDAMELQKKLVRVFWGVYGMDRSTVWIGQKYALKKLGILKSEQMLLKGVKPLTDEQKQRIDKCLKEYGDLF